MVSRPRRFGKTVDADMLVAYYARGCDSRALFEGLAVEREPSFEQHLNAHDVIKINVQNLIRPAGSPLAVDRYLTHRLMRELRESWPEIKEADEEYLPSALEEIWAHKESGFVFVIDEWDCIFRTAADDDAAQRNYLDFLRDLLKDRPYVDACYMTGILPIKKYGLHSALNLFTEYSMTDPKLLSRLVGFNDDEVISLCQRFGMDYDEMARWYDGYLLGTDHVHVYNPRSVAGAIADRSYSSFWTSTETYEALQVYIDMDFDGVQSDLAGMLGGQHIPAEVGLFENDMRTFKSKDDMYTLLVHLGYLGYDQVERTVFIPNEEIRREFARAVQASSRPQLAALVRNSRELQRRTLEGDCAYVAAAVERAHNSAAGPTHYHDEQALRAAVKLAFIWSIDDYLRVDELPGGRGYADVVYLPKPGSALPPLVVELKWNRKVDAAIAQIKRRSYPAALAGLGGPCVLVGITYHEDTCTHECVIERIEL